MQSSSPTASWQQGQTNRVARLVIGVRDLKQRKYASAQTNINQSVRGPITDLVATLLSAWASYGAGDTKTAVANIDKLTGPEWYPIFQGSAFRVDPRAVGQGERGRRALEQAYKLEDSMLRVSDDYARWLSRSKDAASSALRRFTTPLTRSCRGTRWFWKDCAKPRPARRCRPWPFPRKPAPPGFTGLARR